MSKAKKINLPLISTNLVEVAYFAAGERYTPNATGLVEAKNLQPVECGQDEDNWEDGEDSPPLLDGWTVVIGADGQRWAVEDDDLWIEIIADTALTGGWGTPCPTGGLTSWSAPTARTDDGRYIAPHRWS